VSGTFRESASFIPVDTTSFIDAIFRIVSESVEEIVGNCSLPDAGIAVGEDVVRSQRRFLKDVVRFPTADDGLEGTCAFSARDCQEVPEGSPFVLPNVYSLLALSVW